MRKTILLIILLVALGTSAEYPAGEKLTIVCVGDSITYGYGLPDREHNAWPAQLQALLGGGQAVLNLGVSGTTALRQTGHSYVNTPEYRTALNSRPDIVLIKLGTNDSRPYYRKYIDSFYRDFEFMGLQRHLKILGIFCRLAYRDGKHNYLADLPLVLSYVRKTAQRYNTLIPLLRLLDELEDKAPQVGYTF